MLQTLTPARAISFGLDPMLRGAVVSDTGTRPQEDVARALLFEDVIVSIDGKPVSSAEEALDHLAALPVASWAPHLGVLRPGPVR